MGTTLGLRAFQKGRADLFKIDPRQIEIDPGYNVRDFTIPKNIEHVQTLKASIIENGLKEPLTVRLKGDKCILVNGESRLRAVMLAIKEGFEIETVPCQADDRYANDADRVVGLITRNAGKDLEPLEKAQVVRRLLDYGWDQKKIATKLAFSDSYISYLKGLLAMPEEAKEMVRNGEVSASGAAEAIRVVGEEKGVEALKEATAEAKDQGRRRASAGGVRRAVAKAASEPETVSGAAGSRESSSQASPSRKLRVTLNADKTRRVFEVVDWLIKEAGHVMLKTGTGDMIELEYAMEGFKKELLA